MNGKAPKAPVPSLTSEQLSALLPTGVGSIASIHLDALAENAARVRTHIGDRFFWAVVKANGYGLGAVEAAEAFRQGGADGFAVAHLEEAQQLRAAGFTKIPILLMGPPPRGLPDDANLVVTATTIEDLRRLAKTRASFSVQIKVDTGMGRLGLQPRPKNWLEAIERLGPRWRGLWTHYSHADVADHPKLGHQREVLRQCVEELQMNGYTPESVHLANSGGLRDLASWETGVRVGLFLYGVYPWESFGSGTEPPHKPSPVPVVEWVAPLRSLRRVAAGTPLSYRSEYTTDHDTVVAVLPVGYADGMRALFDGVQEVWTREGRKPIRGRVTMDLTIVELGPDTSLVEGDAAYVLGPRTFPDTPTVLEVAGATARIPYEVLTGLGPRVIRHYLRGR